MLRQHGFEVVEDKRIIRGTSVSQIITARDPDDRPLKLRVRLCWRQDGSRPGKGAYSAAQLRARLIDDDWDKTLTYIVEREYQQGNTHNLLIQNDNTGFTWAALIPSQAVRDIWEAQRAASAALIDAGKAGRRAKNHAANGSSPTLWLQDDRTPAARAVADILWGWPGVIDVLALPVVIGPLGAGDDTWDDLPLDIGQLGRDLGARVSQVRSGIARDPKVREAVLVRAGGACEREDCGARRDFLGFLDVHHILGVESSDRVWTCVALCPNCHREAHFAPDKDAINAALEVFALAFAAAAPMEIGRSKAERMSATGS